MKFEEINLKFKKFEKVQDNNKVFKSSLSSKKVRIYIQSQMLLEDTQYFQYCNTAELRAVPVSYTHLTLPTKRIV